MKFNTWLIGCLVLLTIITGVVILYSQQQSEYQKTLKTCANPDQKQYASCIGKELFDLANKDPAKTSEFLTYIYQNARDEQPVDLRLFSDYSHDAGMILAGGKLELVDAAEACGDSFKGGCLHGYVMDKLDEEETASSELKTLTSYCDSLNSSSQASMAYLNCLHGVGHEIWAKGRTNLSQALSYCDSLTKTEYKNACWSGVIMEYSKNGKSTGHHSHAETAKVDVPCQDLNSQYKLICYASQGSYRQYYPGKESLEATYKYCSTVPSAFINSCRAAAADRLNLAAGKKLDQTYR